MTNTTANILLSCFDESVQGLALFNRHDVMTYANSTFRSMYAVPTVDSLTWEGLMRNCHLNEKGLHIASENIDDWISRVQEKRLHSPLRTFESDLVDGRWLWVVESRQLDGCIMVVATDITQLKINERTLKNSRDKALESANTDSLTGLVNRRYVFDHLPKVIKASHLTRDLLCVCLIDLDNFKHVNDNYGHQVGDLVLKHFASKMQQKMRPIDIIGRIGGDEFLIIFPGTNVVGASRALSRLKDFVAHANAKNEIAGVTYSFSAGVAQLNDEDNLESLLLLTLSQ